MKRHRPILITVLLVSLIIFAAPYTRWEQCGICGVQQYERGIARIKIRSWSVEEFDEYGTYAQWRNRHKELQCAHQFSEVKHKTPKMSLDQLKQP